MGTAALNLPTVQRDRRGVVVGLGEPAVGVGDPFVGQALEEGVEVFVVAADAPCLETSGQEDGVNPVRFAIPQHGADQLRRYREPIPDSFVGNPFAHGSFREVEDYGFW